MRILILGLLCLFARHAWAQETLNSITLSTAVTGKPGITISTGITSMPGMPIPYAINQMNFALDTTYDSYTTAYGFSVAAVDTGTHHAGYALNASMSQNVDGAPHGGAAAEFSYTVNSTNGGDGGALQLDVFNNSPSGSNYNRGVEINCWGPNPCLNGIAFVNQASPNPGGYFQYGIEFNQGFSNAVSVAFISDNGSSTTPVNVQYGTWYDGSSLFTTAEYSGPGFQIGPTATRYNSRVRVSSSAVGQPSISPIGSGSTPATNANLALAGLGTGGIVTASQVYDRAYAYATPASGATVIVAAGIMTEILDPAASLTALTLTLQGCVASIDGALFRFTSSQSITSITANAASGTVKNAPKTISPGSGAEWICRGASTTWFRLY